MYKITKTINDTETINLVFDDAIEAKEVFSDLQYDEYIRFKRLYACGIKKETRDERIDGDIIYRKYRLSVPTFSIIITLEYVED